MTKTQLKRIREAMGLRKGEFARLIRVDPATITRWEAGTVEVPPMADLCIRLVAANGGTHGLESNR